MRWDEMVTLFYFILFFISLLAPKIRFSTPSDASQRTYHGVMHCIAAPSKIRRRRQPSQAGAKRWVSPDPSRAAHSDRERARNSHAQGGRDKGFAKVEWDSRLLG